MRRNFITPLYIFNMIVQSLINLVTPIGLMLLAAWFLVSNKYAPPWIYVILILVGVFVGLFSMVSFILKASRALEALERQRAEKEKALRERAEEEEQKCTEAEATDGADSLTENNQQ